jgi:hypothetical protein
VPGGDLLTEGGGPVKAENEKDKPRKETHGHHPLAAVHVDYIKSALSGDLISPDEPCPAAFGIGIGPEGESLFV